MKALTLSLASRYGKYSPEHIQAAVIGAMSICVYVKYRNSTEEMRTHFFDVIGKLDDFLFALNEVRAFNVDQSKLAAYGIFTKRYRQAFHPTSALLLDSENNIRNGFISSTTVVPEVQLIDSLVTHFQQILRDSYGTPEGKGDE